MPDAKLDLDTPITLDPENTFEKAVLEMVLLNRAKSEDYAGTDEGGHLLQNFYDSAYQMSATPGHSLEFELSKKAARLRVLLPRFWGNGKKPKNESIRDTVRDRAVYSTLALVAFDGGDYQPDWAE